MILTWLSVLAVGGVAQGPQVFTIDTAASHVLIQVGKEGLLGFAGHAHEVLATAVTGRVSVERRRLAAFQRVAGVQRSGVEGERKG